MLQGSIHVSTKIGLIGDVHSILSDIVALNRYRFIINGHSHHRMVRRFADLTIINAGTLRRDHSPCFAAIDFERHYVMFWDIVDQKSAVPTDAVVM